MNTKPNLKDIKQLIKKFIKENCLENGYDTKFDIRLEVYSFKVLYSHYDICLPKQLHHKKTLDQLDTIKFKFFEALKLMVFQYLKNGQVFELISTPKESAGDCFNHTIRIIREELI